MFFFFFQAEDGIRDIGVTGVQTCALPISPGSEPNMKGFCSGGRKFMEDHMLIQKWIYELSADIEHLRYAAKSRRLLPGWDETEHIRQLRIKQGYLDGLRAIQPRSKN